MNKINLNDVLVRRAIWEIHGYKCFYTFTPLDFMDMELDHIIPLSLKNKPVELKQLLLKCNLDEKFEIDSLYNLVPTLKRENRRKSSQILDSKTILLYLNLIKNLVPKIEAKVEELKKKRNFEEHITLLKTYVDSEKDQKKSDRIIENIINFVSNDNHDFEEEEGTYYKEEKQIYKKYSKRIGLEAIMPHYNNTETSCIIYFSTLMARDCMIVLDNKTILSQLFGGIFTDPIYGTREFIEYKKSNEEDLNVLSLSDLTIHIGNNKLRLSAEDIIMFCDVIDSYAKKYIQSINYIENILHTHRFPLSKRKNNYKFIRISYGEWIKLVDFCCRHDVDYGNTEWNIFDRNKFFIKVFTKKESNKLKQGYHAFFNAEYEEDKTLHPILISSNLYVTFEFIEDLDKRGVACINIKENWDAETAYKWLVEELIPKVFGKKNRFNILGKRKNEFLEKLNGNSIKLIDYYDSASNTLDELIKLVTQLQEHYNGHPHNRYRVLKENFYGVYNSIILCLKKIKNTDLYYICNKLHLYECKTIPDLIETIENLKSIIEDTTIRGFGIDLLFRAFLTVLESKDLNLYTEELLLIKENIGFFIDIQYREILLEKYAYDFNIG